MKNRVIAAVIIAATTFGLIFGIAKAAPTSTTVQNLFITNLKSTPTSSLVIGADGLVSTGTVTNAPTGSAYYFPYYTGSGIGLNPSSSMQFTVHGAAGLKTITIGNGNANPIGNPLDIYDDGFGDYIGFTDPGRSNKWEFLGYNSGYPESGNCYGSLNSFCLTHLGDGYSFVIAPGSVGIGKAPNTSYSLDVVGAGNFGATTTAPCFSTDGGVTCIVGGLPTSTLNTIYLQIANNLSDLTSTSSARTALGYSGLTPISISSTGTIIFTNPGYLTNAITTFNGSTSSTINYTVIGIGNITSTVSTSGGNSTTTLSITGVIPAANGGTGTTTALGTAAFRPLTDFLASSTNLAPSTTIPTIYVSSLATATGTVTIATSGPITYTVSGHQITLTSNAITTSTISINGVSGNVFTGLATGTAITAGTCTSCNLTYNSSGLITVAANGSGGGLASTTPFTAGGMVIASTTNSLSTVPTSTFSISGTTVAIPNLTDGTTKYTTSTTGSVPAGANGTSSQIAFFNTSTTITSDPGFTYSTGTQPYFLQILNGVGGTPLFLVSSTGMAFGTTSFPSGVALNLVGSNSSSTGGTQLNLQNSTSNAFSEFVATMDTGNANTNFVGFGINNSAWAGGQEQPGDAFIEASTTGGLNLETVTSDIMFYVGGVGASTTPAMLKFTINTSTITSSVSSTIFNGNIVATSTQLDTVGSCGTSPAISGSFGIGVVTTGNNASSTCTITFSMAFKNKPVCTISSETATFSGSTSTIITPAAASLKISMASSTAMKSAVIDYICIGK